MKRRTGPHRWPTLAKTSAATAVAAAVGSIATTPSARWYRTLDLPRWQPPAGAFPLVWTALYADLAATSAAVIDGLRRNDRRPEARRFGRALGVNLVLNAGWSAIFWRARRFDVAALDAAALTASSAALVRRAAAIDRRLGLALMPYVVWCGFATVLTTTIWRRNGTRPPR